MTVQEFLEWMEQVGAIKDIDILIAERTLNKEGYFLSNKIDLDVNPYPGDNCSE